MHVRYTVWSRGRLIGETDLGFPQVIREARSGWFHPNAEGERLMPIVAAVSPAMRAYIHHRHGVEANANGVVRPEAVRSTPYADLAEALQRADELGLELRREDGSVVATEDVGIQDTEHLLALAREIMEEEPPVGEWTDDLDDSEDSIAELLGDDGGEEPFGDEPFDGGLEDATGWCPLEPDPPPMPRYQIHVLLREGEQWG